MLAQSRNIKSGKNSVSYKSLNNKLSNNASQLLPRDLSHDMRIDEEDQLEANDSQISRLVNQRGQSQVIRSKALMGKGNGAPMSAMPFRGNLVPALHSDEMSAMGDGLSGRNQQEYDEAPVGEDFSTSANTGAQKSLAL